MITFMGDEIRLKPIPAFPTTHAEEGMRVLARKGRKPLSDEETELAIGEMLKEADQQPSHDRARHQHPGSLSS